MSRRVFLKQAIIFGQVAFRLFILKVWVMRISVLSYSTNMKKTAARTRRRKSLRERFYVSSLSNQVAMVTNIVTALFALLTFIVTILTYAHTL